MDLQVTGKLSFIIDNMKIEVTPYGAAFCWVGQRQEEEEAWFKAT